MARRRDGASPGVSGLVLLDKPAGISSFAAIARLRPVVGRRIGHAGTLDPFATGLLLVLAGGATRLARYLSGVDKRYRASVAFGATSSTDDPEGEIAPTGRSTTGEELAAALARFVGEIDQVPPAASAIKIAGERAYRRFRRGEAVEMPSRRVVVHDLALRRFDGQRQEAELDVWCGSGTYVRALARDLGEAVGAGAYLGALRRTHVGPFAVDDALPPDEVARRGTDGAHWRSPLGALPHLPERVLDAPEAAAVAHGRALARRDEAGPVRLSLDGRLVAVASPDGEALRPQLVLEVA